MAMLSLDNCCFCIDLRVGCLIIGYLNVFGNIALAIVEILAIRYGVDLQNSGYNFYNLPTVLIAISAVGLVFSLLYIIFSVLLVVGIHKHIRVFVKSYLLCGIIFLILSAVLFFVDLGLETLSAGAIVRYVLSILITLYFLLVVRSYYYTMGNTQSSYNA